MTIAADTRARGEVLLRVRGLAKHFTLHRGVLRRGAGAIRAVDGISFDIRSGETLGLVGESGSGKSTTARLVLQLESATAGTVCFGELDLTTLAPDALRRARREMQMIFQDPYASLNPRMRVADIVREPLDIHGIGDGAGRNSRVRELLELVGLEVRHLTRFPHEFSGGQRQRIGIARALATQPGFIVADEPISALDVSIQAQIVNLLEDLRDELGLTYLFIAHDLSMVRHISDRVAVMYLGRIVEIGDCETVFSRPRHPYTRALISAVPGAAGNGPRDRIEGEMPDPASPPAGCRFHTRCPYATGVCRDVDPGFTDFGDDGDSQRVACHHAGQLGTAPAESGSTV